MDDGLELNFAVPSGTAIRRQLAPKKGGRWTDRVKAKQNARRVVSKFESGQPQKPAPLAKPDPAAAPKPTPAPAAARPAPQVAPRPAQVARPVSRPAAPRQSLPKSAPRSAPKTSNDDLPSSPEAGPSRLPMDAASKTKAPQVISSLFTANPILPKVAPAATSTSLAAPSNAPLVGDANTFAGLGLDPLLVHHLTSKMNVSAPTGIQKSCLPYMLSSPLDTNARREEDENGIALEPVVNGPRDIFIQSQTGSGKTLSYLLPIIQTLLPLSKLSYIDRSIGTLAIILAPTRELAQQISKVLEALLSLALSLPDEEEDRGYTRWLVSGLLVGGSTRTHEKAKLRKGVPILVSTPGRLLDHLQNTSSFQCAKTLFLVLDEADRLMDLGFEETIQGILKALEGRRRNEINAEREQDAEGGGLMRWPYWNRGRQTVLCSATVDAKVERLSGMALRDPVTFRPLVDAAEERAKEKEKKGKDKALVDAAVDKLDLNAVALPADVGDKFTPPSQLAQKYVVTPTKLRLVTLVALLRSLVGRARVVTEEGKDGTKVIVFLSSTDAVDYHWKLLGGVTMGGAPPPAKEESEDEDEPESMDEGDDGKPKASNPKKKKAKAKDKAAEQISLFSQLVPKTTIHRLHGSLPLKTRLASLASFAAPSASHSILLATSVASRGLDLPLVRAVVQYDLPTEGGANEYVHRVGRTARAGKGGEAWAFVAPSEQEWVPWVEAKMGAADGEATRLVAVGVEDVLRRGFGGRGHEYEARATDTQLAFERWVLEDDSNATLARKAFASFIRAYSTHPLDERRFFHVKAIHLGHLAKAFALREAPGALAPSRPKAKKADGKILRQGKRKRDSDDESDDDRKKGKESTARNETEARMYEAVRKQGRSNKVGGVLAAGGSDYHVMSTGDLEALVKRR